MHTAPCPQDPTALLSAVVRFLLLQEVSEAGGAPLLCWDGGNQRSSYFHPLRLAPKSSGCRTARGSPCTAEKFRSLHMGSAVTGS